MEGDFTPESIQYITSEISRIIAEFGPNSGLRMVTPQAGCPEGCSFCSQNAMGKTANFTPDGLKLVFSALSSLNGELLPARTQENTGRRVITAHYDNDVGSYPYLREYLKFVNQIDSVARLSTVGWSRHNQELQGMHEEIANSPYYQNAVYKMRFSFQPYTQGARGIGELTLDETLADITNALRTYKPLIESRESDDVIMELRYFPNVILTEVSAQENEINFGPYKITRTGEASRREEGYVIEEVTISGGEYESPIQAKLVELTNDDGTYYDIKTDRDETDIGIERSIQVFPKTQTRGRSGYIESTSFFREYLARASAYGEKSWDNIAQALSGISNFARIIQEGNPELAEKLTSNVLPWSLRYVKCIYDAGLDPEFVYRDSGYAIGHETILNHGRALGLFKGLASKNTPMSLFEYLNYDTSVGTIGSQLPQIRISPHEEGIIVSLHEAGGLNIIDQKIIKFEGITEIISLREALDNGLLIGASGVIK